MFKNLVVALNSIASALHDLASSLRATATRIEGPKVPTAEELRRWRESFEDLKDEHASDNAFAEPQPTGNVVYNSDYEEEREREAEEMREYLASREYKLAGRGPIPKFDPQFTDEQENQS